MAEVESPEAILSAHVPPVTEPPASDTNTHVQQSSSDVALTAEDGAAAPHQPPSDGTAALAGSEPQEAASVPSSSSSGPSTPPRLFVSVTEQPKAATPLEADELAALHRWLACVCVVTFDLEMGPTLEYCFPPNYLSQAEITNGQPIHALTAS